MEKKTSGGGLATLLTTLLVIGVLVEAGIASYVGVNMQMTKRANEEIMAQRAAYEERQAQIKENPPAVQYAGPAVRVVNGTVTQGQWEPAQPTESRTQTYSSYSPSPVPKAKIPEIDTKVNIPPVEAVTSPLPKSSASTAKPSSGSSSQASGSGNADNFNAHNNPDQQKTSAQYVLNTNTKKFHYPSCNDVK